MPGRLSPILFVVTGALWTAVIFDGGGMLLLWPAAISFLSALAITVRPTNKITNPLAGASSLFGLVIAAYQVSVAASLGGSPLGEMASYSVALFTGFGVIYLVLLYLAVQSPRQAED